MRRTYSLRNYLVALVLIAVIPAIAAVTFAVWRSGSTLRAASTAVLLDGVRTMAGAVERELDSSLAQIAAAATAEAEVARTDILPEGFLPVDALDQARRSGRPLLSNLLPDVGPPRVAIVLPPIVGDNAGRPRVIAVAPERLLHSLPQPQARSADILVAVTDGNGRIVARSMDAGRVVGQRAPDWDTLLATGRESGTFEAKTAEGMPIFFAFSRLDNARGWTVVAGEPLAQFNARWQRPLQSLVVTSAVSLVVALIVASLIAGMILRPIRALADNGRRITANAPVRPFFNSRITEFEDLRASLQDAEAALRRRAEAERESALQLAASEQRYRSLAGLGALVFWRRAAEGHVISATGWTELTGRPENEAMGEGWTERVHPDDRALTERVWLAALAGENGGVIDVEFRVRAHSERWQWVRARGTPMRTEDGAPVEWAGVLEDVDERRQAQARIAHMAHHDALTGLPNRLLFAQRLQEALDAAGGKACVAVLCIDLDGFKEVNDTLGHPAGDRVLNAVGRRLAAHVREGDTVARLGGDEFAIVLADGDDPAVAAALAGRVIESLAQPFDIDGQQVHIGASVGIAGPCADAGSAESLIRDADSAMYRAKQLGRGRYCFFQDRTS